MTHRVYNGRQVLDFCETQSPEKTFLLLDYELGDMTAENVVIHLEEQGKKLPFIIMTGHGNEKTAVKMMKLGAEDYLVKGDYFLELLVSVLSQAIERLMTRQSLERTQRALDTAYQAIMHANNGIVIARAIHNTGCRKDNPFIPVNCTSIPDMLLESELFGHIRGSFTGAVKDKIGLIEAAHTGTLFLDEIGDMPINLQPKLLRVLQDHKVQKIGSIQMTPVAIRVIAATNQNLHEKINNGSFRKDLYYRLSVVELSMPPLRERGNDICLLASHFLKIFNGQLNKTIHGFSTAAHKALTNYSWPGNIRELENAVEHAATLCQSDGIELSDLPVSLQQSIQPSNFSTGTLDERIFQFEHYCLRTTLEKCNHDFVAAANQLGISVATLYRKAKKHQLSLPRNKIIDIPAIRNEKHVTGRQPHLFDIHEI